MNKVIIVFLLTIIVSCIHEDQLEIALKKSKTNRKELEQILSHYSKDKSDSLKLHAARFLIENMPGHYTYTGNYLELYKKELNIQNPGLPYSLKSHLHALPLTNPNITNILEKQYDIETIKSDFLIKHIDYKFMLWNLTPWSHKVSFEDFCEYLLPYRVDIEPIQEGLQDSLDKHMDRLVSLFSSIKNCEVQMFDFKDFICGKLFKGSDKIHSVRLPFSNEEYQFDCIATAYDLVEKYKAIGIPSRIDFTPHWASDDNRHYWNSYEDPYEKLATVNYLSDSKLAKIYRKTFSHHPNPLQDGNYIPEFFTPFIKDVTNEYIKTFNITHQYTSDIHAKNVYLAVFNQQKWQEVAWSILNNDNKAIFRDLGGDIIYLPTYYLADEQMAAGYPFYLGLDGKITELIPDEKNRICVYLTRKYPKDLHKIMWEENISGAIIEASDNADFSNADTICRITDRAYNSTYHIEVKGNKKYRYFRIVQSPERLKMFLAQWTFMNNSGKEVRGKIIVPSLNDHKKLPENYLTQSKELESILYDKNVLSYSTMIGWIGMDFNKPTSISTISIILRNDGNDIYPGDIYELFYHNQKGWCSLGTQKAADKFVEFDHVPSGALYWLRNLTGGKEERIFTYENNNMKFW